MTTGMPASGTGRCLCGTVRYEWRETPLWAAHCHCESCRRACAAPFTSFFGVRDGAWDWTAEEPALFESSPGVRRWFCRRCGSQMAYQADRFPGETHFYAATMDRPEDYRPTEHVHGEAMLPWVRCDDGLPVTRGNSA